MIEDQLTEAGRELRSAVANRLPGLAIDDGLADITHRHRARRRRRRATTVVATVLVVLVVAVAAFASVREQGQHVAAGPASPVADATDQIPAAIAILFEPGPTVDDKLAQVADSDDLRHAMTEGMTDPRAPILTVTVTSVDLHGSTATAHIDFFLSGAPALRDATLDMVHIGDRWVAERGSYCSLIATTGPACPSS